MNEHGRSAVIEGLERLRHTILALDQELAEDDQLYFDTLDGETDVPHQLRQTVRRALMAEACVEGLRQRQKELAGRLDRYQAAADACRGFLLEAMDVLGLKRLPAEDFFVSLVANPPRVVVTAEADLPPAYVRTVTATAPNREAIARALKAGERVPGAVFANPSFHIVIKKT